MNPGAPAIAALSGEPGIASVPAPRALPPDCSPVAVSRPVTGLSRASCRDASGLAVLMSTGRRAGLPGLSRRPRPRPRWPGQALAHHRPGPPGRHLLPPPAAAVGCRVSRTPGGWASQGTSHARGNGRPPGRWAPGCLVGCPACSLGRGQRAAFGLQAMFLWRGREGSLGVGSTPGLPEAARVRLPPGDLDSVSGRARLYYRHAAELFETATRGMRGGRRTVRR